MELWGRSFFDHSGESLKEGAAQAWMTEYTPTHHTYTHTYHKHTHTPQTHTRTPQTYIHIHTIYTHHTYTHTYHKHTHTHTYHKHIYTYTHHIHTPHIHTTHSHTHTNPCAHLSSQWVNLTKGNALLTYLGIEMVVGCGTGWC